MRITDPSYQKNGWGNKFVLKVKNGKWKKTVKYNYDRPGIVIVYHTDYESKDFVKDFKVPKNVYNYNEGHEKKKMPEGYSKKPIENGWYKVWRGIGVDTARVCYVDEKYFMNEEVCPNPKQFQHGWHKLYFADDSSYSSNNWEEMIDMFQKFYGWNEFFIPYGYLCLSGWGDGCYQALVQVEDEKVIAVKTIFINEPEK